MMGDGKSLQPVPMVKLADDDVISRLGRTPYVVPYNYRLGTHYPRRALQLKSIVPILRFGLT
jgi:hypothetical protein